MGLAERGFAFRAEVTHAAMASRAEPVTPNTGPRIVGVAGLLNGTLWTDGSASMEKDGDTAQTGHIAIAVKFGYPIDPSLAEESSHAGRGTVPFVRSPSVSYSRVFQQAIRRREGGRVTLPRNAG